MLQTVAVIHPVLATASYQRRGWRDRTDADKKGR